MLKDFEDLGWEDMTPQSTSPHLLHVKQNSWEMSHSTTSLLQKLLLILKPVKRRQWESLRFLTQGLKGKWAKVRYKIIDMKPVYIRAVNFRKSLYPVTVIKAR